MGNYYWAICHHCDGHGSMDNPAFSDGFTNSELYDMSQRNGKGSLTVPMMFHALTVKAAGK